MLKVSFELDVKANVEADCWFSRSQLLVCVYVACLGQILYHLTDMFQSC